jgi:CPA2 family monovalent cation:H+ antiporter-2
VIIPATVITMLASPFLTLLSSPVYALFRRRRPREAYRVQNAGQNKSEGNILIIGGGSVGGSVAAIMSEIGLPFVVIEQNYREFEKSRKSGYPVLFGDGTVPDVLKAAGLAGARLVMITVPSIAVCRVVVEEVRRLAPHMHIIARAAKIEQMKDLDSLGVYETVQPEFEAGIEFFRQALAHCEMPLTAIQKYVDDIRYQQSLMLHGGAPEKRRQILLRNPQLLFSLRWVNVHDHSSLNGQTIAGLDIRKRTGASVVGVYRGQRFVPNPQPDFQFMGGDLVAIIADGDGREKFDAIYGIS